jgi:hypothetical protein
MFCANSKNFLLRFFLYKKKYVVIVETMDNKISLYRGLPGNREFSGIQGLPYFIFNPLRNLLFTKEDIDHSASETASSSDPFGGGPSHGSGDLLEKDLSPKDGSGIARELGSSFDFGNSP